MAGYKRPDQDDASHQSDVVPTRGDVIAEVRDVLTSRKRDPVFARQFMDSICEHERPFEGPHRVSCIGGGGRYEYAYRTRVLHSLNVYLDMSDKDRGIIHAGVEDGVKWCGEPVAEFIAICNEFAIAKEMPIEDYRKRFFDKARNLNKKVKVEKVKPKYVPADEAAFGRQGDYEKRMERRKNGENI